MDIHYSGLTNSQTDPKVDPIKTRITPATSIQFLFPGKIDDNKVYWITKKSTTLVLQIMFTVLPEKYLQA